MDAKNNDPNEPEQKKIPLTWGAYHLTDVRPGKTTTRRVDGR